MADLRPQSALINIDSKGIVNLWIGFTIEVEQYPLWVLSNL